MIDLAKEKLIRLSDVPELLPPRANGKRVHVSAVYRWVSRGVRGVRLESVTIGGTTYTSLEALQRHADRLSEGRAGEPDVSAPSTKTRQHQIDRASQRVNSILGKKRGQ